MRLDYGELADVLPSLDLVERYGGHDSLSPSVPDRVSQGVRALEEGFQSSGSSSGRHTRHERGDGSPVYGAPVQAMAAFGSALQEYRARVDALCLRGMDRMQATAKVAREFPELRAAVVREANAHRVPSK